MALKRPAEKHWNWRTPPEPFPQTPGANGCFLAPSGQGKTTTLISMLLGPYSKVSDEIHVFSPSVDIDSAWDPVKDFAKGLTASSFHSEWDEKALHEIMANQKEKIKQLKLAKSKRPLPLVLTILDDHADRADIMHAAGNILTTLFIRGRHFGSSCWIIPKTDCNLHSGKGQLQISPLLALEKPERSDGPDGGAQCSVSYTDLTSDV